MSGTLFIVSTPIGNLGDVTRRAAETLGSVDAVCAEDTRRTRALLAHLGIVGKPMVKLDANATSRVVDKIVDRLATGQSIALVTDAGTPSVSDPGTHLVRAAALRRIPVLSIPGPSAVTAAVAVSGLVDGPFLFLGFLPRKGEKRRRAVRRIATSPEPVVLFEAPGRVRETLAELSEAMPSRQACLARELTKLHEEIVRGTLSEIAVSLTDDRGEHTIVIAGAPDADLGEAPLDLDALIDARLDTGEPPRTVAEALSALTGEPRRSVYTRVLDRVRARGGT